MHHLLGLGCRHSETVSDLWDSFVSWLNLIKNKDNLRVTECLDFYNWSVTQSIPFVYFLHFL